MHRGLATRARVAAHAGSSGPAGAVVIIWHRTDLRVDDNPVLCRARDLIKRGQASSVLPVYVLDPRNFRTTAWGSPKIGKFRAKFLLESICCLKQELRSLGSDLLVQVGHPENCIADLARRLGAKLVLTEQQIAAEECRDDDRVRVGLRDGPAELSCTVANSLYSVADVPFARGMQDLPDVFTKFRVKCEDQCEVRAPQSPPANGSLPLPVAAAEVLGADMHFTPSWADLPGDGLGDEPSDHPQSAFTVKGGAKSAMSRLQHYLWETDTVARYFDIRNGMVGTEYSTKLSASLAFGCISARRIYEEIRRYEEERKKNKSTYWVIFELLWRDFFRCFAMKHGSKVFQLGGTAGLRKPWYQDTAALERWKTGQTGWPLVDANMRELMETGWMSNRGRQNVASYLALDLGIDWRAGADHFESLLVDYDVTSNWGNWVSAAGLTGGRINKFNISKQAKDYDAKGDYVRLWCAELRKLRGGSAHEPWKHGGAPGYPKRLTADALQHSKKVMAAPAAVPKGGRGGRGGAKKGKDQEAATKPGRRRPQLWTTKLQKRNRSERASPAAGTEKRG